MARCETCCGDGEIMGSTPGGIPCEMTCPDCFGVADDEPTHCACGAELMPWRGQDRSLVYGLSDTCADCRSQIASGQRDTAAPVPLDARIRDAQQKPDPDPSSDWTAGATPAFEWP